MHAWTGRGSMIIASHVLESVYILQQSQSLGESHSVPGDDQALPAYSM